MKTMKKVDDFQLRLNAGWCLYEFLQKELGIDEEVAFNYSIQFGNKFVYELNDYLEDEESVIQEE